MYCKLAAYIETTGFIFYLKFNARKRESQFEKLFFSFNVTV